MPLWRDGKVEGVIAIFRNRTEVTRLAQDLTGVQHIVGALRAYTHEFTNKLHVILGLLQLGEDKQAEEYVLHLTQTRAHSIGYISERIREPSVAALLIGKVYRAAELGIRFVLDPASELHGEGRYLPASSLITILGNLIENAFDALRNAPETAQKEVTVSIREGEHGMLISVDDSGAGIAVPISWTAFSSAASPPKERARGTGLSLVKETVDAFHGDDSRRVRAGNRQLVHHYGFRRGNPQTDSSREERSAMYTTVIIEDDPMITRLNRRYIEQDSRFAVVQTFSAAHPALFWLRRNPIDLIILDVYMPQMSGTELLLQLRAEGVDADVIMVTSANDAKTVNDAVRLGAVDYLVKPFAYERFRQALDVFCRRRESVQRDSFSQDVLDHTLFQAAAPTPPVTPPKGLQSQTLSRIEAYLRAAPETRHTSDEIASHVGLSVVTVRRYMNYLAEQQVIGSEMDYRTGGRPCLVYFLRK